jgi:hypothetical protein
MKWISWIKKKLLTKKENIKKYNNLKLKRWSCCLKVSIKITQGNYLFVYDNNFLYSKNFSFCLMFEKNGRFDSWRSGRHVACL